MVERSASATCTKRQPRTRCRTAPAALARDGQRVRRRDARESTRGARSRTAGAGQAGACLVVRLPRGGALRRWPRSRSGWSWPRVRSRPAPSRPVEHLRVGLAGLDPGLQRQTDLLGDAPVVELRDHFDLRSQTVGDAHAQRADGSESRGRHLGRFVLAHASFLIECGRRTADGFLSVKPRPGEEDC